MQATAIRLFPAGDNNTGRLVARAALYDFQSALISRTELATATAGAALTVLDLPLEHPAALSPGLYGVGLWFANQTYGGSSPVNLTLTYPATMRVMDSLVASESWSATNGSLPALLAPWQAWSWPEVWTWEEVAPLVKVVGLACSSALPAAPISLNASLYGLLDRVRQRANGRLPGLGAVILQLPSALTNLTGAAVPSRALCPFVPLAQAVSGVRRADAVTPEPLELTDRWQLSNYSSVLTAVLVHAAVEDGRLHLNQTVADVFPYLPLTTDSRPIDCGCQSTAGYFAQSDHACSARIHPSWLKVNVAHLLSHMSGLYQLDLNVRRVFLNYSRSLELRGQPEKCTGYSLESRRYVLSQLLRLQIPNPPPGPSETPNEEGMGATATNPFILGCLLEEVHGREWESLATELLTTLQADTAGFGPVIPAQAVPLTEYADEPYGHMYTQPGATRVLSSTTEDVLAAFAPAGRLVASLIDWARMAACQLQEGRNLTDFPPPQQSSSSSRPPYLLSAATWQSIHERVFFPDGWMWLQSSFTPSTLERWDGTHVGFQLAENARTEWWSSASRLRTHADPPFAILLSNNAGHPSATNARTMDDELDWRNREAVQAAEQVSRMSPTDLVPMLAAVTLPTHRPLSHAHLSLCCSVLLRCRYIWSGGGSVWRRARQCRRRR